MGRSIIQDVRCLQMQTESDTQKKHSDTLGIDLTQDENLSNCTRFDCL